MVEPVTYDPERRFLFSNTTNEDFIGMFENTPTLIEKGKTIELSMFKAYLFTKHLVDREMMKDGKEGSMGSPEARKVYEDRIVAEITAGDSPALATLKEKIKEEIQAEETKKKEVKEKAPKKEKSKEFDGVE